MEQDEPWQKIESFLRNYERAYAPMRWFHHWGGLTRERQGYFVFLRFVFLVGLYATAYYVPLYAWSKMSLSFITIYLIADMFMLPTLPTLLAVSRPCDLYGLWFLFSSIISRSARLSDSCMSPFAALPLTLTPTSLIWLFSVSLP